MHESDLQFSPCKRRRPSFLASKNRPHPMLEALFLACLLLLFLVSAYAYHARDMWSAYKDAYERKHEKLVSMREDLATIKDEVLSMVGHVGKSDVATREKPTPDGSGTPLFRLVQEDLAEIDDSGQVVEDLKRRAEVGREKYGQHLRSDNGRDPAVDAYQEALDLLVYLRQMKEEGAEEATYFDVKVQMTYESIMHEAIFLQEAITHAE